MYFILRRSAARKIRKITSSVGARIVVDDLRLEKLPLPKCAWMLEKDAFLFLRISPVAGAFYSETDPMFALPREKFFPFVDKYGQLKHKNWRGKIQSDGDFKVRIEEENKSSAQFRTATSISG